MFSRTGTNPARTAPKNAAGYAGVSSRKKAMRAPRSSPALYAPLVFIKLGTEAGGRFIREVFPVYYVAMDGTSIAATILLIFASTARGTDAVAMGCIGMVIFLARFALLPIINHSRDAGQAGNLAAKKRFDALHRVSVIVNVIQMLAVLVVLARFAAH